ncbi:MAG: peptide MFS transporter [Deltaproteobacteria bacterium]|nr:peptide MFS transporter [Deltaproteobacteria bacterium]
MRLDHPRGLYILFFSELWERFSFYGMRALLVLYMTKQLLYADSRAYGIYGAYGALVYAFPVIGGLLADRLLGYRRAIILGGVLMALGHFMMAVPHEIAFYCALALLCLGNGFFKPNVSSLVGKLYGEGDPRRDSGFTIFYMGINIGAFLAPLVCGLIGETFGWHFGFSLAGVGMLVGLGVFLKGQKLLEEHGLPPNPEGLKRKTPVLYLACLAGIPMIALGLNQNYLVGPFLYVVAIAILTFLIYTAFTSEKTARDRLLVVIVLMFFHCLFWAFFEQAGSSLTLFADRNVDRNIFGWIMPASLSQSFNPFFIILFAPLFAKLWIRLQEKNRQPSIPIKFVLGIFQLGLGFWALVIGASFAKGSGLTAMFWLVLAYFLHTTGELCLSPVGLSAVTKLSPAKAVGTVMGAWFLSISFAHHLGGAIAKLTETKGAEGVAEMVEPVFSLPIYSGVFMNIFLASLGATLLLWLISPFLKKRMHGVE